MPVPGALTGSAAMSASIMCLSFSGASFTFPSPAQSLTHAAAPAPTYIFGGPYGPRTVSLDI